MGDSSTYYNLNLIYKALHLPVKKKRNKKEMKRKEGIGSKKY